MSTVQDSFDSFERHGHAIETRLEDSARDGHEVWLARPETEAAGAWSDAVVEMAPDGIVITDAQGQITLVNRQTEALFGYRRSELLGQPIEVLVPEGFRAPHRSDRAAYIAAPRMRPMGKDRELFGRRADGTEFPVDIALAPVTIEGVTHIIATYRDATGRLQVERQLREQDELLTRTSDAMSEAVYVFDRAGKILRMNAAAQAFVEFDMWPEFAALPPQERLPTFRPRDAKGNPLPVESWPALRVLRGETITAAAPAEVLITSRAGREQVISVTGAPLRDADGEVMGAVLVSRDVTAQRQAERQRADILRVVAHDLANPIAAVRLYLQNKRRNIERGRPPRPPAEEREVLSEMARAVTRMQRLVDDMRVVLALEEQELSLDRRPCDLAALCQREAQAMQAATGHAVRVELPPGPVLVSADPDRLGQVVTNLLSNADKYSPLERPITLSLQVEPLESAKSTNGSPQRVATPGAVDGTVPQQARVLIRDEGLGIPPQEQPHLWERFHRVPGTHARSGTGGSLGFGLYICHELVERHGGAIGVESTPGQSSTFWFTLPLATAGHQ